jgi:hypothetical protein
MTAEAFLLALAALGIAIAGFSGLIVTLPRPTSSSSQTWKFNEASGVKLIIEHSFALVFLSLLPIIIFRLAGSEQIVWKIWTLISDLFILGTIML